MKCNILDFSTTYFASNVYFEKTSNSLRCDLGNSDYVLIVQTDYGYEEENLLEKIQAVLTSRDHFEKNVKIPVNSKIQIYFASSHEFMTGYKINSSISRYYLYACQYVNNEISIYRSDQNAFQNNYTDVSLEISVHIKQDKISVTTGFFKRVTVEEPTGFYSLTFESSNASLYKDGAIMIKIGKYEIPITKDMLKQGTVYMKTDSKPIFINKKGISVKEV